MSHTNHLISTLLSHTNNICLTNSYHIIFTNWSETNHNILQTDDPLISKFLTHLADLYTSVLLKKNSSLALTVYAFGHFKDNTWTLTSIKRRKENKFF